MTPELYQSNEERYDEQNCKEHDHSVQRMGMTDFANKAERLEQKFSEPTGNSEVDSLRAQFVEKIQELRNASSDGNVEQAQQIREELKSLKDQLIEMRNSVA